MAIIFSTGTPKSLLSKFDAAILQHEKSGKIETWEKSDDGKYYTHKANEWRKKAWFKPSIEANQLVFNIVKPQNTNITKVVYGYYHGHLIETFLNHFDTDFEIGSATALPTADDKTS
ncbi:hypothetical protein SAMN05216374_2294 [Tardiphaga sp. OK246]|jgi:hypothetical protein|uniref:hypothetical protein n=1 Tax=Tardiphaga sp. OK246 TaxID=1855307 RepID=UPI000B741763|nr:hypothetical protein [Tardiphaga sp. OK246]SNT01097.1 hypothetical protein SAMN05216374_2294 [Tardiphaga sp. OK246]